jgi:hypothetical protein
MYTVFTPEGAPKVSRLGLVHFVRTLAQARAVADPGDTVTGWSRSGSPRGRWVVRANGRMTKLPNRERRAVRYARNRERS